MRRERERDGRGSSTHRGDAYKVLFEKPGRKRQFVGSRLRWGDNIEMDLE
jgi:hypothetical protein